MASVALAPQFETTFEEAEREPRRLGLSERDWDSGSTDWDVAALAPDLATERTDEYIVEIDVETDRGNVQLPLPLRVRREKARSAFSLTGTQYRLTLQIDVSEGGGKIHWHLDPGGRDAAGRKSVIDLLVALSGNGVMVLRDPEYGDLARAYLQAQPIDGSLVEERDFLIDVLAIEAWSGRTLPLPDEIDEKDFAEIAQFARWIRDRTLRLRFMGNITAHSTCLIDKADELHLFEVVEREIFGVSTPLGLLEMKVPVELLGSKRDDKQWVIEFEPPDDWLTVRIKPPLGRRSVIALRKIDEGMLPERGASEESKRRQKAREAAQSIVEESGFDEQKQSALIDQVRREWPI